MLFYPTKWLILMKSSAIAADWKGQPVGFVLDVKVTLPLENLKAHSCTSCCGGCSSVSKSEPGGFTRAFSLSVISKVNSNRPNRLLDRLVPVFKDSTLAGRLPVENVDRIAFRFFW